MESPNTIIISCPQCSSKYKIRNPQPGATFVCHRCKHNIQIPGNTQTQETAHREPDIVKIELNHSLTVPLSAQSQLYTPLHESSQIPKETRQNSNITRNLTPIATLTPEQLIEHFEAQFDPLFDVSNMDMAESSQNSITPSAQTQDNLSPIIGDSSAPIITKPTVDISTQNNSQLPQTQPISSIPQKQVAQIPLNSPPRLSTTQRVIGTFQNHSSSSNTLLETSNKKKIFADDLQNRLRLLYMISRYTKPAERGKKGTWIRKFPLQVLMFEGVVNKIFDWDYAPASVFHDDGRCFINISQEGEEDLLALLSNGYVHNLKLTTNQHRNITAYQITQKGLDFLATELNDEDKKIVDQLIQCPKCSALLWACKYTNNIYLYCCKGKKCGHLKLSSITKAEDVSYFCVPYFVPSLSNFTYERPIELQQLVQDYFARHPQDNIQDRLEELIYLSHVKILVSEWIPFGSNHLAALNYKLGSHERVQSAKFTQEVDCLPNGTLVEVPDSLTLVKVRDYRLADYVDFEAISHLPEDQQVVQVEEFAVHIDSKGLIRYGLEILAINERDEKKISIDHLPRVMVDILQDSTTMMETLLTNYQKNLLELIFQNKAKFRDKYFFLVADELHCFEQETTPISRDLIQILCQANYQDELNQITEEVKETSMFPDGTVLILGTHGSILVTHTPEKYEFMISDFMFAMDIEIFLNNFFARLFLMNDELKDIQNLIKNCETDPNAVSTVQQMLSHTSSDIIRMEEVRRYLDEAVALFSQDLGHRYVNCSEDMQEILQSFRIPEMTTGLHIRIKDMQKIIQGTQESLQGLSHIIEVISERQMRRIQEALSNNTRSLEDMTKTNERSGMSLRILEIILAGSLAFNIMDQFTGGWELTPGSHFQAFLQYIFDIPGVWLLCSLGLWGVMAFGIYMLMNWLENINTKALDIRLKLDLPCDIQALQKYLKSKNLITYDADVFRIGHLIKVGWEERDKAHWLGNHPKIELVYDEKNGFLLSVLLEITSPTHTITSHQIQEIFLKDLSNAGILKRIY